MIMEKMQENVGCCLIRKSGFYKLTIGYLTESQTAGALRIFNNNRTICSIDL